MDLDQELQKDARRFKELNKKGLGDIGAGAVLEYLLWTGAMLTVIAMVVSMPWVGADKVVPGTVWLGYSMGGLLLFGSLAFAVRWIREHDEAFGDTSRPPTGYSRGR